MSYNIDSVRYISGELSIRGDKLKKFLMGKTYVVGQLDREYFPESSFLDHKFFEDVFSIPDTDYITIEQPNWCYGRFWI